MEDRRKGYITPTFRLHNGEWEGIISGNKNKQRRKPR